MMESCLCYSLGVVVVFNTDSLTSLFGLYMVWRIKDKQFHHHNINLLSDFKGKTCFNLLKPALILDMSNVSFGTR